MQEFKFQVCNINILRSRWRVKILNLLEIWIDEIISEEELENEMIRVKATYVCWGAKETKERIYPKNYWEQIKKKGYYLG